MLIFRNLDRTALVMEVSRNEFSILNNALNEALNALDDRVFPTRMGASVEEVEQLLLEFRTARRKLRDMP